MGAGRSLRVVLDAGALIAIERGDPRVLALIAVAHSVHIPAGALAQAWRHPDRQTRISRTVRAEMTTVHALDFNEARAAGVLCGRTGTNDVIDASVALLARRIGGTTVTSDPDDLRHLDPTITLYAC